MTFSQRLRSLFDVDQILIFFLLAVTVNQMGHFLARFEPDGLEFVGYLQAAGVDLAIWRSAWWFRRYRSKKQRRWAMTGVVLFALVSTWYNSGYYGIADSSLAPWTRWLMGAILPLGVALLSYLKGQKDESQFSTTKVSEAERQAERTIAPAVSVEVVDDWECAVCHRSFASQQALAGHMKAHNNGRERTPVRELQEVGDGR